jgi:hypothetical protein
LGEASPIAQTLVEVITQVFAGNQVIPGSLIQRKKAVGVFADDAVTRAVEFHDQRVSFEERLLATSLSAASEL